MSVLARNLIAAQTGVFVTLRAVVVGIVSIHARHFHRVASLADQFVFEFLDFIGRHLFGFQRNGVSPFGPFAEVDQAASLRTERAILIARREFRAFSALGAAYNSGDDVHAIKIVNLSKPVKAPIGAGETNSY